MMGKVEKRQGSFPLKMATRAAFMLLAGALMVNRSSWLFLESLRVYSLGEA
jgi:hypothetical protein